MYNIRYSFLRRRLQESEKRYANREPREEDVKQITDLKELLTLKDSEIKKLIVSIFL